MSIDIKVQIAGLTALRAYVVETRRSAVAMSLVRPAESRDQAIKKIVECHEALAAIDAAIKEEMLAAEAGGPRPKEVDHDGGYVPIE